MLRNIQPHQSQWRAHSCSKCDLGAATLIKSIIQRDPISSDDYLSFAVSEYFIESYTVTISAG